MKNKGFKSGKLAESARLILAGIMVLVGGFISSGQDKIAFAQEDSLEQIRAKIEKNQYKFTVGETWVYKLSPEEKARMLPLRVAPPQNQRILAPNSDILLKSVAIEQATPAFDWRNYNGHSYVGAVRNQGALGSCYAFGACAAAETTYNIKKNLYDSSCSDFAEMYIIWTLASVTPYSSHFGGGDGADYDYYELYGLTKTGPPEGAVGFEGVCNESDFPYSTSSASPSQAKIDASKLLPRVKFSKWSRIFPANYTDTTAQIKTAISSYGVLDVAVNVDSAFESYTGGIYENTNTQPDQSPYYYATSNHAVALVGWDDNPPEGGGGVWILRNSWGPAWGESGYMRIRYFSAAVNTSATYLEIGSEYSISGTISGDTQSGVTLNATGASATSEANGTFTLTGLFDGSYTVTPSKNGYTFTPATRTITVNGAAVTGCDFTATVSQTLYSQGFENGGTIPSGWTQEYVTGTTKWIFQNGANSHPVSAHGGSYNALLYATVASDHKTRLVMPMLDFGATAQNAQLKFWHCMEVWTPDQDQLNVYYKTSQAGAWTLIPGAAYESSVPAWTMRTLSLPNPNSTYYIAFEGNAKYGYGVCIDDVEVITGGTYTPTVTFTAASQSKSEGGGAATVTAQLSAASSQTVAVPFTVTGTASNPADYTITVSPITIPAGSTTGTATVTIVDDAIYETPDETVIVTMGTPTNASKGASTVHTITVTENDSPLTVSFTAASQSKSEGGGTATVTAQLSATSSQTVTVPFTVTGTASNPADYTITASPITIPAGSTTGTVTVTIVDDAIYETPDETVIVTMGTPTNAIKGASTIHTITITENDPPLTVTFTSASQSKAEIGGTATITAQLSGTCNRTVTVPFTVTGTASNPADYTITASPITIPAGSTTGTVTVTIVNDASYETPDETVIVTMGMPTNATQGAITVHTLTIIDDNTPGFTLSKSASTVSENGGKDTFTAVLTTQPASDVVLSVISSAPSEVTAAPAALTFTAANWNIAQTVTITGVNDNALSDDTATVTVSVIDAASDNRWDPLPDKTVAVTCTNDDSTLTVTSGGNGAATPSGSTLVTKSAATAINATANTGYHFVNWTVTSGAATFGNASSASTTAAITAPAAIRANFAINDVQIATNPSTLNVNEGSANTFQVKLTAQPTADKIVSVSQTSGDTDISVIAGASMTFTTENWGGYQTVTVAAAQDADTANGTATITCAASGLSSKTVTVNEVDDDSTLTVTSGGNGTATPSGSTVVTKAAATAINATANTGYHFVNWTVTSGAATFGNASSASTTAAITAPTAIRANFAINDVKIATDLSTLNVNEGSTNTFQVKLTAQPTADKIVSVSQTSGDTDISVIAGASMTFTTENWGSYQTVTVAAAQDADTANGTATITCAASGLSSKTVTVNEVDDDSTLTVTSGGNGIATPSGATVVTKGADTAINATANTGYHFVNWTVTSGAATFGNASSASTTAAITAPAAIRANFAINDVQITTDPSTLNVNEGSTNTFQIKLTAQPTANKIMSVLRTSGDTGISVTGGASLTFTTENWGGYQTVTVAAAQDADTANGTATITCAASGLSSKTVTVNEVDDDSTLTVTSGGNGTATPSGSTVVTKAAATAINATANTGYHFVNWTVTSGTAAIENADARATTVSCTENTAIMANFIQNVVGIITDPSSLDVPEGGTAVFRVKLSAQPTVSKTVAVSRTSGDADINISSGASLTFTTANWDSYQDVSLGAAKDADVSNGSATITCTASGVTSQTITATEIDNDYTLYVSNDGNGTTAPSGAVAVQKDSAKGVSAVPNTGYHFLNWTITGGTGSFNNTGSDATAFTASADANIRADFEINTYTVTFDLAGKGSRTGGGALIQILRHGSDAAAPKVTPHMGWAFTGWNRTLSNVSSKLSIVAQYSEAAYPVGVTFKGELPEAFATAANITVTGLPAGLKYDAATKLISGVPSKPGRYIIVISAPGLRAQTINITVEALPLWAQGSFTGVAHIDLIDDSDTWQNFPGTASMSVTSAGKITGKISYGGKNVTFSAASYSPTDEDGVLGFQTAAKIGTETVPLIFTVRLPEVNSGANIVSASLGSKADASCPDENVKCEVHIYRNVWNDADMAAMAEDYAGYYTAVLPGAADYGSGYLSFTLDKAGKVKTAGKLADGTAVSLSGTLIYDEKQRLYTVIYISPAIYQGACLFGLLEFAKRDGNGPVILSPLDEVLLIWENRNPKATPEYGEMFNRRLDLIGGWYDKVGNLNDYYKDKALTTAAGALVTDPKLTVGVNSYNSTSWNFSEIKLIPVLNRLGVMTGFAAPIAGLPVDPEKDNVWDYNAKNTVGLKIGLTRATGVFKGSFKAWFDYGKTHTYKSISYEGILTPERKKVNDGVAGRGFFLWPDSSPGYPFNWSYDFLINE